MVPFTELNVADPVAYALRTVGEDRIAGLLSVGAIAGLTTVLLVAMFAFVRVSYSMSRDGLLPKDFQVFINVYKLHFLYMGYRYTSSFISGISGFEFIS